MVQLVSDLSQVNAYSNSLNIGVVANRITGEFGGKKLKTYVAFVPNLDSNVIHWKGAVTWGAAGFCFDVKISPTKNKIIYTLNRPLPQEINQIEAQKFIDDFISKKALKILTDKVNKKTRGGSGKNIYPMLHARKFSTKLSSASDKRVVQYEKSGVFDANFSKFIMAHHNLGIRCVGQ